MDVPLAIALAGLTLAVLCACGAAFVLLRRPRRSLPVGGAVIVCTRRPDDQSVHGVLVDEGDTHLRLAACHYLPAEGDPVPIGEVVLRWDAVAFVQTGVAPIDVRSAADATPERAPAIPLPDQRRPERLREAG